MKINNMNKYVLQRSEDFKPRNASESAFRLTGFGKIFKLSFLSSRCRRELFNSPKIDNLTTNISVPSFFGMTRLIVLYFFLSIITIFHTNAQGIQWQTGSFESILNKAKAQKKLIYVDIYTTWCTPCKQMDAEVFTNTNVGKIFNENFINYKIDGEKGEGKDLVEYFELDSYPTSMFIDGEWNIIQKLEGFRPVERLLESAEKMKERGKISGSDDDLEQAYLKGKRDAPFLLEYIKVRQLQKMDNGAILDEYLGKISPEQLKSEITLKLITENASQLRGRAFDYLMSRKTEPVIERKIKGIISQNLTKAGNQKNEKLLTEVLATNGRLSKTFAEANEWNTEAKMNYFMLTNQADKFFTTADFFMDTYVLKKDLSTFKNLPELREVYTQKLRKASKFVVEHFTEREKLEKGVLWIKKSLEIEEKSTNNEIYSRLLFTLGNKIEAIRLMDKALLLAKQEKADKGYLDILANELMKMKK
jgi:thiol-disulfide isomerase/thioredoxin